MALKQAIEFQGLGSDEGYWVIASIEGEVAEGIIRYMFAGYASQQAKEDGKNALAHQQVTVPIDDELASSVFDEARTLGYLKAKQDAHFKDAVDV